MRFVGFGIFLSSVLLGLASPLGNAQPYPNKPVRIFASEAGGNSDLMARLLVPGLTSALGQPIVVENRGGSVIGEQTVATSAPDGHSLIVVGSNFWISPLLEKRPYDPMTDFSPVIMLQVQPSVLVVNPTVPVKSVKDLIALAKAKPNELNYGSGPAGTLSHLGPELFKLMAGVNIVRVPYKGGAPAATAVVAGEVQLAFLAPPTVIPHIKSGRLTALAVTTVQPTTALPGVPTLAASGLPGFEAVEIIGLFAPAKTPTAIIRRLNDEITRIINQPEMREKFDSGVSVDRSPEAFAAAMKSSRNTMAKVISDVGLSAPK